MTEQEAHDEALRRNLELRDNGVTDCYWIDVELPNGEWSVEERHDRPPQESKKQGRASKVVDVLLDAVRWWP